MTTKDEALREIIDRLKDHPAYADLDEQGQEDVGGDTAEFAYLVGVAEAALAEKPQEPVAWFAKRLGDFTLHDPHDAEFVPLYAEPVQQEPAVKESLTPQQGPVAWGMSRPDGLVIDTITPEEHASFAGEYTVPLYAEPVQQSQDAQDAKRYRAIRGGLVGEPEDSELVVSLLYEFGGTALRDELADAAIDAAIAAGENKSED